mmetsp:Transcript_20295/g.46112  ORF Transcript_20295/g.46112 Transcript_20295/m.46112 type:complete len:238 (-) Transcript_20295:90-803(-)
MADKGTNIIIEVVAPALGVILSTGLGFGPLPAILKCRRNKTLGETNPDPFVMLFGNAVGWIIYAASTRNAYVFAGNFFGVLLGMFYVLTGYYLTASDSIRRRLEIMMGTVISLWLIVGYAACYFEDVKHRNDLLGITANVLCLTLFASPLSTAAIVIQTKSAASINPIFAVMQVVNCTMWTTYGLAINDIFLLIPNALGLVLGLMQCALLFLYRGAKAGQTVEPVSNEDGPYRPISE